MEIEAEHIDLNRIPAPWPRLQEFENENNRFSYTLKGFNYAKNNIQGFNEAVIEKVKSFKIIL